MILSDNDISTTSSGIISEESFGIGNIGLIFDILRNKMYKDPILAICREIMCNARDAHRESEQSHLPIEVYLPHAFSPYFKVKDFGLGISPDRMSKVFIQYAASTKRTDNIQNGGFGLGSKTPFSYSDTFTIITTSGGVKRIYNAFIDESKVGKILLVEEKKVDERSGTMIVVPVLKDDYAKFAKRTIESTQYWETKPKLVGNISSPSWTENKISLSGNGWVLFQKNPYSYQDTNSAKIIIDGIEYDIDAKYVNNLTPNQKNLLKNKFAIHFNNGELSLSPSRDHLHYDEKTQASILDRLKIINDEVVGILHQKVLSADNYISACILVKKFFQQFSDHSFDLTNLKWKDNEIRSVIDPTNIGPWVKCSFYEMTSSGNLKKNYVSKYKHIDFVSDDIQCYHNDGDLKFFSQELVLELCKIHKGKEICIMSTFSSPNTKKYKDYIVTRANYVPQYNFDLLSLISKKLSEIKLIKTKKIRSLPTKLKSDVNGFILYTSGGELKKAKTVVSNDINNDIDKDKSYYFELKPELYEMNHGFHLYYEELKVDTIYGFSSKEIKKLCPKWVSVNVAIENKIAQLEQKMSLLDAWELIKRADFISIIDHQDIDYYLSRLNQESIFVQYLNEAVKIQTAIIEYSNVIQIAKTLQLRKFTGFEYKVTQNVPDDKFCRLHQSVIKRYPLINLVNLSSNINDAVINDAIIDYINLIDENEKLKKEKI